MSSGNINQSQFTSYTTERPCSLARLAASNWFRFSLTPWKSEINDKGHGILDYKKHYHSLGKCLKYRAHDCRNPITKDYQDTHKWDAFILAHGLKATCDSVDESHTKPIPAFEEKKPDKLLFHIGNEKAVLRGAEKGQFNWPRGLAVSSMGEIAIADTMNHRIQVFNSFGVLAKMFGEFGTEPGQFNQPTGVSISMNGEISVADNKNKRVQLFTRRYINKDSFSTIDEPYSICTDVYYNTIVATSQKTIEIYRRGGKIVNRFSTFPKSSEDGPLYVGLNEMNSYIIVCDPGERRIKTFDYSGDLISEFEPANACDGLGCHPAGIHVLLSGQIIVADTLNHSVTVYTDSGDIVRQLLGPTDGCGSVQQVSTGPEGHMITTEYSSNNMHCMKIYRYKSCDCHSYRPGSSKRPDTPNMYKSGTIEASITSESMNIN